MALNNDIIDPDYINTVSQTEGIPQRKALVVKITEQRVKTSRFLQPGAKNDLAYSFPSSRMTGENYFSHFSARSSDLAASDVSSMKNHPVVASISASDRDNHIPEMSKTTHTESQSQAPSCLATQETQTPVVLRRKATIIRVQEQSDTVILKDVDHRRKMDYRHSFNGLHIKPQLDNECMLSGAEMQVLSSKTKLYRSTVSLQLTSSNGPRLNDTHSSRGLQPRRPASCYASLFSPVEPSANGSQDAAVHSTTSVLPHETNIDLACSMTGSSNRCWSTEGGAGSHEKIYSRTESSASDKGQSRRESALPRNQPLTLIKVPGRKPHGVLR